MARLKVNGSRFLERHQAMAACGATGKGGVIRPALSDAETDARKKLLDWARARNFSCAMDPIGNLFIRRSGLNETLAPIRFGSHLDSQMPGGNYDGVFGVLAAFEVLETIEDHDFQTDYPLEVVIWNNEEGCRFQPTTMGSLVHAGKMAVEDALKVTDVEGISVGAALQSSLASLGPLDRLVLGSPSSFYLEAHIEQGPLLEANGFAIGIVTDIQGIAQFRIRVKGEIAHAGTTPKYLRKDALRYAMQLIEELSDRVERYDDRVRFTVGSLSVWPGAVNTVPGEVVFTIDLRHPDATVINELSDLIANVSNDGAALCQVDVTTILKSAPVQFDPKVVAVIREVAQTVAPATDILSGATHDAKQLAPLCPTGMIFIPCFHGISHNEREFTEPLHMINGADVLLQAVLRFAGPNTEKTGDKAIAI
ncbi:M20 family metallo-hydrolase [Rhizobium leguminosarum]|uniref:M20 family metallo-hydrolase n=1 Tax=Rhizobium leguminosarum TaxID=384 RepID=UPI0024A953BC|nr:M20 family metallo-hydrolase [Rhizobium leguminosarum]MDI5929999.1 M20 family metallo-hydrolase [Rhizobium leguminosarum]